jgi:hypothetical protein
MADLKAIAEHGEPDEVTPYERGLTFGQAIANCIGRDEMAGDLDALAAERLQVPMPLRSRIMHEWGMWERLAASEYCDADGAFWQGFAQGVRSYITSLRAGATKA